MLKGYKLITTHTIQGLQNVKTNLISSY